MKPYPLHFMVFLTIFSLFVSGCSRVTYPKETIERILPQVLLREYGLIAQAKLQGETLDVAIHFEKLWGTDNLVEKQAWKDISKLKFVASRVALSTDAKIEFIRYVISGNDSDEELNYIRAMKDEKLLEYQGISVTQYWNREVLVRKKYDGYPDFEEVKWEDFLSRLISKTVQEKYKAALALSSEGMLNFWGVYFPKESPNNQLRQNLFALVIQSKENPQGMVLLQNLVRETTEEVCGQYQKFPFERLRILNLETKNVTEVPSK
ncbi:MAG: hypothetical protein HYS08_03550 [Chlamydiae bacterium]|nr:hypothetical protein [Chlamydiota bacterium]MBI3266780.1 hypothetical protein [Chlamydiota bacterium]